MKRNPAERKVFYGTEVENTAALGCSTVFFAGVHETDDILRLSAGMQQIYLTANQSYAVVVFAIGTAGLIKQVMTLLQQTEAYVAVDVPAVHFEEFSNQLALTTMTLSQRKRFIVQISVLSGLSLPDVPLLYCKLDADVSTGDHTVNGVHVVPLELSASTFTPWEAYVHDKDASSGVAPVGDTQSKDTPVDSVTVSAPELTASLSTTVYQRSVTVHFMRRGIHCYPEAATNPKLATGDQYDVSYLATPHAHDFWFKVEVGVNHNDRDIEFIQMRQRLEALYDSGVLQCGRKSCEMLAEELIHQIVALYGTRYVRVSVFEDALHANGGTVTRLY